jgi:hypothetical protein|nr:MAG TPA: hypothetical protein [Caudoviricetes sp.]
MLILAIDWKANIGMVHIPGLDPILLSDINFREGIDAYYVEGMKEEEKNYFTLPKHVTVLAESNKDGE